MTAKQSSEKAATREVVELQKLNIKHVKLRIEGISSLIPHAWSSKAKQEMLDKQMKKAKQAKQAKDPWMDYCESLYWLTPKPYNGKELPSPGDKTYPTEKDIKKAKFGFPAVGFKCSMVTAVTSMSNITKVAARQAFHIDGEFVEIIGYPVMREDTVRLQPGTADLRYRGEFKTWEADVTVSFNANVFSADQIINLLSVAGFGVGIGDWRPEKNGDKGRFLIVGK